jgi:hypothetical protein
VALMLDLTPDEWLRMLLFRHQLELDQLTALNNYYEGCQPLRYLHPELMAELGEQMQQVVINWPRLVVDAVEERLDVTGFRLPDAESGDKEMWRVWKANGMADQSQRAHIDALVMRRSFIFVGTNPKDADTPLITAESPLQVFAYYDPATRAEYAVVKRWHDTDPFTGSLLNQYATLLLPDSTHHYKFGGEVGWKEIDRDEHGLGMPPAVTLANRGRLLVPGGISELADILPISDAACKIATDMMVGSEFHAIPRRYALGFDQQDFLDQNGQPVSIWSRLAGRIWSTSKNVKDDGVAVGQFPESDLKNFHSTIELLARMASALAALPPNYMGLSADDAASDAAIRSREARLVKRAERKCGSFGSGYEQVQRLVRRFQTKEWDPALQQLETLWADPATPTYAQKADAITKLVSVKLLPREQAWEDLGYSSAQQARMQQMFDRETDSALGPEFSALIGAQRQAPEPATQPPVVPVPA